LGVRLIAIGGVRHFGQLVKQTEEEIIRDMDQGKIQTEPSITDRYLGVLQHVISEKWKKEGLKIDVCTLRDMGPNAPEHKYGADFIAVLDIKIEGYKLTKGFLCQAKKESDSIKVLKTQPQIFFRGPTSVKFGFDQEFIRLKGQANDMLQITPASFVIVYSMKGFVVVPASSVASLSKNNKLYAKSAASFFKEFLMCFIGDPNLKAWDNISLESLRDKYRAKRAVMFSLRSTNFDSDQVHLDSF
jgi:hypothetical protein